MCSRSCVVLVVSDLWQHHEAGGGEKGGGEVVCGGPIKHVVPVD